MEYKEELVFSKSYKTTANIAASDSSVENFISESDRQKYAPFTNIFAVSADSVVLGLVMDNNPDNIIPISAGGSSGIDNGKFGSFAIKNHDSANVHTAGKVHVVVQKYIYKKIEEKQ